MTFCSIIISTTHPEAMLEFYKNLGFVFERKNVKLGGFFYIAQIDKFSFAIQPTQNIQSTLHPGIQLSLKVPNINDLISKMNSNLRVAPFVDPIVMDGSLRATLVDPDGRSIELIQEIPAA